MNLKTFQQSELKRFDDFWFENERILGDTIGVDTDKIKLFINSAIEKAFALGKAEKEKEILAKLPKKKKDMDPPDKSPYKGENYIRALIARANYNEAIYQIINLLKNK